MTKLGDWSGVAVPGERSPAAARRAGLYEIPRIDVERWREVRNEAQREATPLVIAGGVAESTAVRHWSPRTLAGRDLVWYGMLGRPCRQRLFSPPPLGVDVYRMLARKNRLSASGEVAR